jgi:hypothetical protein
MGLPGLPAGKSATEPASGLFTARKAHPSGFQAKCLQENRRCPMIFFVIPDDTSDKIQRRARTS